MCGGCVHGGYKRRRNRTRGGRMIGGRARRITNMRGGRMRGGRMAGGRITSHKGLMRRVGLSAANEL